MEPHVQELVTLKTIAESLNQSNDLSPMLNKVLEKLLELTGLTTGWIFLEDGPREYSFVADHRLPPALAIEDKRRMRCGSCWCMDRYWDGRLKNAVNILNCKRIEDAIEQHSGDTYGITHHATVPLKVGNRWLGVMNVAAPGKSKFTDEELALLEAVAFQIGSAIERVRLYEAEQQRAKLFAQLGEFSRSLSTARNEEALSPLEDRIVDRIGGQFGWPYAALVEAVGDDLLLRVEYANGRISKPMLRLGKEASGWLHGAVHHRRLVYASADYLHLLADSTGVRQCPPELAASIAVPISLGGSSLGALVIGFSKPGDEKRINAEVLEALSESVNAAFEGARYEENRREFARLEERNRLARDLHDSVSQMLFSLSMTAKGVESLMASQQYDSARASVRDIRSLSQDALKEMRALIMQLRPAGLEAGLLTALKSYGNQLGLKVDACMTGVCQLPRQMEEALWRIGQEALNNVSKHAGVLEARVDLEFESDKVRLRVTDKGRGMSKQRRQSGHSIGLSTMRERTEALGGQFNLTSIYRKGTVVEITLPLEVERC